MKSGKLKHRVTIEALTTVVSSDGGSKKAWTPVAEGVWASIEPLRGKEWFEAGGAQSEVDHRIRMRYRGGIKASMRIVHKGRFFEIQYPADVRTEHRELHLMCKEYGNDQASRS